MTKLRLFKVILLDLAGVPLGVNAVCIFLGFLTNLYYENEYFFQLKFV